MGKYKIYGNRFTKGPNGEIHPSIDLGFHNGKWENIEITDSPTSSDSFTEFDDNPNPKWREKDEFGIPINRSFFRRYVRKDPIYAMLGEYKYYSLTINDEKKIDEFLKQREQNILIDKERRVAAIKRKQEKNDAKLRYHQSGRSANRHKSAHASLHKLKQMQVDKARKSKARNKK